MPNHQIIWHNQLRCDVYSVNDDLTLEIRVFDLPEAFGDHITVILDGWEFPNPFSRIPEEEREARATRRAMEDMLLQGPIYLAKVKRDQGIYRAEVFYSHGNVGEDLAEGGLARKDTGRRSPWFTDEELSRIRGD